MSDPREFTDDEIDRALDAFWGDVRPRPGRRGDEPWAVRARDAMREALNAALADASDNKHNGGES